MKRLHARLALLLPAGFRRRYEKEISALLAARHAEVAERRLVHRVGFWLREMADLLRTLAREWSRLVFARRPSMPPDAPPPSLPERTPEMIAHLIHDLRYAGRTALKQPLFAAVVVLTLAVGIGATTAVYTLVDSVLLRPLPVEDPDRLVLGYGSFPLSNSASVSPPDYLDYRERATSFEALAAMISGVDTVTLGGGDTPQQVTSRQTSDRLFAALGVAPLRGRAFTAEETVEGGPAVAMISEGLWRSRFGGAAVVGEEILIDESSVTIVGILPASLGLVGEPDVWLPLRFGSEGMSVRRFHFLRVVGRLRDGVDLIAAQAEIDAIAADLAAAYPESNTDWTMRLVPFHEVVVGPVRQPLILILSAVAAVLLIACLNVAILLLARSTRRAGELAMRKALGASPAQLARLLLAESLLLATVGGLLGVLLAYRGVAFLVAMAASTLPRSEEVAVDGSVLVFSLVLTLGTGLAFGLMPALRSARNTAGDAMRGVGRVVSPANQRLRGALVVGQVALSFALLAGAALLIRSFLALTAMDAGYAVDGIVTTRIALPDARYTDAGQRRAFFDDLFARLDGMPAVDAVAGIDTMLLVGGNDTFAYPAGSPPEPGSQGFNAQVRSVTAGYFDTMTIPVVRGRDFSELDVDGGNPVVILDAPFAATMFPDGDAVGERIVVDLGEPTPVEVVGVVGGVLHFGPAAGLYGTMYFPFAQRPRASMGVVLRTGGEPAPAVDGLRTALAELDDRLPLAAVRSMSDLFSATVAAPQFRARIMAAFALSALLLAAAGLYGVLAYFVAERRRELGVRLALGADGSGVVRLVLLRGMRLVVLGLGFGVVFAAAVAWTMQSLVVAVPVADPVSFAAVAVVLSLVAALACFLPARRATSVDPLEVLRAE